MMSIDPYPLRFLFFLLLAQPLQAQLPEKEGVARAAQFQLEEIKVIGERIERGLQDTVSSVGVLTQEQISESALYDIQQAYTRLANVNSSFADRGFTIRGINYNSVSGGGNGGLASMHIDGAVISRRALTVGQSTLWDMQQIEIFRGPQSTNQGRNSLAGAVFMRSTNPGDETNGRYRLMLGNHGTQVYSAAASVPLIKDELALRLAVDKQLTDGFVSNGFRMDAEDAKSDGLIARSKIAYEPAWAKGLSMQLTLSYADSETHVDFVSPTDQMGEAINVFDRQNFANIDGYDRIEQTMFILELDYDLADHWNIVSLSSFSGSEFSRVDDADSQATGGAASRQRGDDTDIVTQEIRASFQSDQLRGNLGAYYYDEKRQERIDDLLAEDVRSSIQQVFAPPLGAELAALYDDPFFFSRLGTRSVEIENIAVFGNVEYDLSEFITLFGGFRFDSEEIRNTAQEVRGLGSALPAPELQSAPLAVLSGVVNGLIEEAVELESLDYEADYDAFLPKAGATLHWSNDLSTSVSIQRAYRAGGAGTSARGNFFYDPEYTTNYELSLRSLWFDRRFTFNANLFYVDWTDQQVQVVEPELQLDFFIINAGKSNVSGFEIDTSWRPSPRIDVFANAGYVKTEFTEFPADEQLGAADLSGNEFIAAPRKTAAAGINVQLSSSLRGQLDINYQSRAYSNIENTFANSARTLVNGKLTYQFSESLELALIARNLFDKDYISLNGLAFGPVVWAGAPRSVGVQLQGRF
ncbi:MAG: TonB-dependent receptor [Pseudomonadota bacterium]